ncbi:MAG: hypothetical protein V5A27_10905, partial [Halapricum sp.]
MSVRGAPEPASFDTVDDTIRSNHYQPTWSSWTGKPRKNTPSDGYDEFYDTHDGDFGQIHTFNQPDPPEKGRHVRQRSEVQARSQDEIPASVIENDPSAGSADALLCGITLDSSLDGGASAVCDGSEYSRRPLDDRRFHFYSATSSSPADLCSFLRYLLQIATPGKDGDRATEESVRRS